MLLFFSGPIQLLGSRKSRPYLYALPAPHAASNCDETVKKVTGWDKMLCMAVDKC